MGHDLGVGVVGEESMPSGIATPSILMCSPALNFRVFLWKFHYLAMII